MSEEALQGYRGHLRDALRATGADIGDLIRVETRGRVYEGILMPRLESSDDWHLVLKLRSGYNIGVAFDDSTRVERLGAAEKPEFKPPPLPEVKPGLPRVSIISTGGTIASILPRPPQHRPRTL